MKYQHIVFDIDGTLINTEYAILHSLQDTLEKCIHEKSTYSAIVVCNGNHGRRCIKAVENQ